MESFVTLATYTYAHEFAVLKLLLEQEDLRFYFENETIMSVLPFYSYAMGGIALKVHPEDVPEAKKILQELEGRAKLRKV